MPKYILALLMALFANIMLVHNVFANSAYVQAIGGTCPGAKVYHVDPWKFYKCECTSYVAWRLRQDGVPFHNNWKTSRWGHAYEWEYAAKRLGFSVDSTPRPGDVALWRKSSRSSVGHVAYVESVNSNGTVNITEYNQQNKHGYHTRSYVRADVYLHLGGGGLSVKDLWRKTDPLYINSKFDAQFKLQNNQNKSVTVNAIAMAIHDANNRHVKDMFIKENVYIRANRYYHVPVTYTTAPSRAGTYYVVAKIKDKQGKWRELQSVKFTLRANQNSGNSQAEIYIDKCMNTYKSYFGNKSDRPYDCYNGFLCQNTTGNISTIAIHKQLSGNKFYYKWGDWNSLGLSNCN